MIWKWNQPLRTAMARLTPSRAAVRPTAAPCGILANNSRMQPNPPRPLSLWLRSFWPAPIAVGWGERLRALLGAALGILLTGLVSRALVQADAGALWLAAPLGASALLVFCLPASPLAQPWPVVGGNTLSALVGVACVNMVPDPALAGALAVGCAIGAMFALRCLHPPGGAIALLAVLTHATQPRFALVPVLLNSVLLVVVAIAYNRATGRPYPPQSAPLPAPTAAERITSADLDAALAHYGQTLDISRADLQALLQSAHTAASARTLGRLRCADVMAASPPCVQYGTPLQEAWAQMRAARTKALVVVDKAQRVVGIVTLGDFLRHAGLGGPAGAAARLRAALVPSGLSHGERAEVVGQVMTRQVRVASQERAVTELIALMSQGGYHHVPVIDAQQRLVGLITEADVVRALAAVAA